MLKTNGGGICDHEVGGGKTMIMCTAAYEMKRLGLANKPMIIGLKANVFDIADTFRKAYPNARILYPGKEDFTVKNGRGSSATSKTTTGIVSSLRTISSAPSRSRQRSKRRSCKRNWIRCRKTSTC